MNKKREIYSDILKIFSIFLVVVIHVIAEYRLKYFMVNGKYYFILTFIDSFTRVAVPIFFMITGTFMLSKKTDKYSTYLKQRIPKLFIPLLLISIFIYIFNYNKAGINHPIITFGVLFLNNRISYYLWFMYAIILIYLLIPFLQVLVQNLNKKKLLYLIILLAVLSNGFNTIYLLTERYNHGILSSFILPHMFSYINYLFIGYFLHDCKISKKNKILLLILSIISICLMPIADHFFINGSRADEMLNATSIFPIIPSVFTYILFKDYFNNKRLSETFNKVTAKISSCVIYIYIIHMQIIGEIEKILSKVWTSDHIIEDILRTIIVSIITFIISFVISYIIVTIKELIKKLVLKKQEKK